MNKNSVAAVLWIFFTLLILGVIGGLLYGCPQYWVYSSTLSGEAELRRAEQTKLIVIESAKAKLESADLLNKAEVKRAEGVAKANQIIGDSLEGREEYLRYLWIQEVLGSSEENGGQKPTIIYIPTEAGLPILEAGKR